VRVKIFRKMYNNITCIKYETVIGEMQQIATGPVLIGFIIIICCCLGRLTMSLYAICHNIVITFYILSSHSSSPASTADGSDDECDIIKKNNCA